MEFSLPPGPAIATNLMRTTCTIFVLSASLLVSAAAVRTVRGADPPPAVPPPDEKFDADGIAFFEKNIRPVLAENCFACHAVGAVKLRGGLLLDSRQGVVKGGQGGPVIVAGEPDQSRLIQAIRWTDPDFQMPPTKKLSAEQIEHFELWVQMGAPDPREEGSEATTRPLTAEEAGRTWWALQPVERPELPAGLTESANPIDAFIAAEYRSKGLTPVGQADKSALLRRVYLDLIGIPPTPAEQEAFFSDTSPGAHEKVVDHLLASKQHGVRYAHRWLDVLRYADVDQRMIAADGIYLWPGRVINALDDDVPYDQFVRAQLTGYRSTDPRRSPKINSTYSPVLSSVERGWPTSTWPRNTRSRTTRGG